MHKKIAPFKKSDWSPINFKAQSPKDMRVRFFALVIGIVIVLLLLLVRLFHLTVVKGNYYRYIAENNRIRDIDLAAPRGDIIDRKGVVLARSIKRPDKPESYTREYSLGPAAAHLIGYDQIADKKDIDDDACKERLKLNDTVGKSGVEKSYECQLRGKKGKMLVEVDALGKERAVLSQTDPRIGKKIQLALDAYLQQKAYDFATTQTIINTGGTVELKEKKVVVVATRPDSGEILLLLSTPSFDPAVFAKNDSILIAQYFSDKAHPLFNRATDATYPPGSVFKMTVAAGALEEKLIDEIYLVEDTGTIKAGPISFGNWYYHKYGKTEGNVNVTKAIQRSNDIFFYKVGEKLTEKGIKKWALNFGYGMATGIMLPEKPGVVPSDFWKRETIGERWFLGDTYNMSIGQGYMLTTPLQVNLATLPFANDGIYCAPRLLKNEKPDCHSLGMSKKTVDIIREGMRQACSVGGTGWPFFDFGVKSPEATGGAQLQPITVGCKTGTAESHLPSGLPHAWFTVFAPYDNPEIVLTVMVEESGEGSNVAAPIAKEILKNYFERVE